MADQPWGTRAETVILREGDRPGDRHAVATMHGELYALELGTDHTRTAEIAGQLASLDPGDGAARPGTGWLWIVDRAGEVAGSIGLTRNSERHGQLRWFLLHPGLRGRGLGRHMLGTVLAHARQEGMHRITLRTLKGLHASHHLYLQAGFRITDARPARLWGVDFEEQHLRLDLG